jgi:hypothetical protein
MLLLLRNERTIALLLVVAVLFAGFQANRAFVRESNRPQYEIELTADKSSVDFGDCQLFQNRFATVKLTNRGARPLKVYNIQKSCACSESELAKYILDPNESTVMTIAWRTGVAPGRYRNTVTLLYGAADASAGGVGSFFLPIGIQGSVLSIADNGQSN